MVVAGGMSVSRAGVVSAGVSTGVTAGVPARGRSADEDTNISLLLCEETIPGSPAPDAEHAAGLPFSSPPTHRTGNYDNHLKDGQVLVGYAHNSRFSQATAQHHKCINNSEYLYGYFLTEIFRRTVIYARFSFDDSIP